MSISNRDHGKTISIYEDGVFAGAGKVMYTPNGGGAYYVTDCAAQLGSNSAESDEAYEAIDDALTGGVDRVTCGEREYTWDIRGAE